MIQLEWSSHRPVSLRDASTLLQALGHPIRLQIVAWLRESPATVTAIVERLELDQPVISRHLGVLRRAGAVTARSEGRERIYRLCDPTASQLLDVLFRPPTMEIAS